MPLLDDLDELRIGRERGKAVRVGVLDPVHARDAAVLGVRFYIVAFRVYVLGFKFSNLNV